MKKLLIFIFVSLCLTAIGQVRDTTKTKLTLVEMKQDENKLGYFEQIEEVKGSKDTLFLKAKQWIFETYKSGRAVIGMEDKEAGVIVGNGRTQSLVYNNLFTQVEAGMFKYSIKINVKENKYKCVISNIAYERGKMHLKSGADMAEDYPYNWAALGKGMNKKQWDLMRKQAVAEFQAVFYSLEKAMMVEEKW